MRQTDKRPACRRMVLSLLALLFLISGATPARDADALLMSQQIPAQGTLEAAFTPDDEIEGILIDTLDKARQQVLVQAYILTSKPLTHALIAARKRGVEVRVLLDAGQLHRSGRDRAADLQRAGIEVWQETKYRNAHNKVIVIDAGSAEATVITGSYNFTWTAQHKNAENILIARKNPPLAARYAANWMRHFREAEAYR